MAVNPNISVDDEELEELMRELGYDDFPPDIKEMVKRDIPKYMQAKLADEPSVSSRKYSNSIYDRISDKSSYKESSNIGDSYIDFRHRSKAFDGSILSTNDSNPICGNSTKSIKRKVLRHRNGQSIITEELLSNPYFPNSLLSVDDSMRSSGSSSGDDILSNSSGSFSSLKSSSLSSTLSTTSTRSITSTPNVGKKKKSDRVARYNYYRKYWDTFKPPGEKNHDKVRWGIRDKMLAYN